MITKTISLAAMSLVSAAITIPTSAIAQINTAPTLSEQTLRDTQQQEKDPLSIGGSNLNLLQLINSINLAGGKSPEKFSADQSESLDEAVSTFKNQQRRDIKLSIPSTSNQPSN